MIGVAPYNKEADAFEILGRATATRPQKSYYCACKESWKTEKNFSDEDFCILGYDPIRQALKAEDLPPVPDGFFSKLKRRLIYLGRYHYIPLIIMLLLIVIIVMIYLS